MVRSWATPTAQIEFFDGKDGTPPRVLPAISEDTLHLSGRSFYLAVTAVASCEGERPTAACATSGHALMPQPLTYHSLKPAQPTVCVWLNVPVEKIEV